MNFLFSALIGSVLGSFPTAWLILKYKYGKNITLEGSGNVGAMNSYEVTNSKLTGIIVLIIDLLKGALSVFLCRIFFAESFVLPAVSLIMAVFTHCFNPWLKFKGGRGLATAAGGSLILFPFIVAVWVISFAAVIAVKKDVHIGNFGATVLTIIAVCLFADKLIGFSFPKAQSADYLVFFSLNLLIIILVKHFDPIIKFIENSKKR